MMDLNWSTVAGNSFEKKWIKVQKIAQKANLNPYVLLEELILRDPEAFKIDPDGAMRPEHAAGPDPVAFEVVVLLSASYYTTVRPTSRMTPNDRRDFQTFDSALLDAFNFYTDPLNVRNDFRVIIYGVCASGRATPLSRDNWAVYSTILRSIRKRDSQQKER